MKEIKTISRNRITEIVRECTKKMLSRLDEMAVDRKSYKRRAESLMIQVLQNWCLVRYAALCNEYNVISARNHWATELIALLNNVASLEITKHIGKAGVKIKALTEVIEERDLNTNPNAVHLLISPKFIDVEGIDIQGNVAYDRAISEWMGHYQDVIAVVATSNADAIRQYVQSL